MSLPSTKDSEVEGNFSRTVPSRITSGVRYRSLIPPPLGDPLLLSSGHAGGRSEDVHDPLVVGLDRKVGFTVHEVEAKITAFEARVNSPSPDTVDLSEVETG